MCAVWYCICRDVPAKGVLWLSHCPTLCNPMDHSMPSLPVLHYLMEFAQAHVLEFSQTPSAVMLKEVSAYHTKGSKVINLYLG